MSHYFTGGEARYTPALRITDKRVADKFFAQLVADNMESAGNVRKRREAEAIERRNLAYFVANMDDEIKARVAKLFKVARLPNGYIKDTPDPTLAPPRPGPHVTPISQVVPGLTDKEIGILTQGGFVVDDKRKRKEREKDRRPDYNPRRRDSWKPWLLSAAPPPSGGWKPWQWIEV